MAEYIPSAPINDEAKRRNQNLPGMGGIFNTTNCGLYHYAANNPVKYTDPDGRSDCGIYTSKGYYSINALKAMKDSLDKDKFSIRIIRSPKDCGNLGWGNENYYKSLIELQYDGQTIFSAHIQSTADHPDLNKDYDHAGCTKTPQEFEGELTTRSGHYKEVIKLFDNYLIHPDYFDRNEFVGTNRGPWNRPYSLGCQIMKADDFNELVTILKAVGFRFKDKETDKIRVNIYSTYFWQYGNFPQKEFEGKTEHKTKGEIKGGME